MEIALEFLKVIENKGYKAYIVGGFVRDYLMGITSKDIDVTTNATPKEVASIFSNIKFQKQINDEDNYGSVRVIYKNTYFDVTTFREELGYSDNRHPSSIRYVNDLDIDLKRRDFTINAICMNLKGEIIDPLNGTLDIKNKIIKTIGDSETSFKDDALRILRAIRFSVTLGFSLSKETELGIIKAKKYLKNISYERKKVELDKIFASSKAKMGIELIKRLDLTADLDLENIDRIKDYTDLIGIWSMINSSKYKFTKPEKELITKVNKVYELDNLNSLVLYKYGLYVNILAGINKGLNKKEITEKYNELPIKAKNEIQIEANEICNILNKKPDAFLNDIYKNLEISILTGNLENKKESIVLYVKDNYKEKNVIKE